MLDTYGFACFFVRVFTYSRRHIWAFYFYFLLLLGEKIPLGRSWVDKGGMDWMDVRTGVDKLAFGTLL